METEIIEDSIIDGVTQGDGIIDGAAVETGQEGIGYGRNIDFLLKNNFKEVNKGIMAGGRHKWVQETTGNIVILAENNRLVKEWRQSFTKDETFSGASREEINQKLEAWGLKPVSHFSQNGYDRYLTQGGSNYIDVVFYNTSDGVTCRVVGFDQNNKDI